MTTRRDLLKTFSGGLLVLLVPGSLPAQESGRPRNGHGHGEPLPQNVSAWLHIDPQNNILVYTGKAEVGQNIRTSLTQAVADELRTNPAAIQLVMADTALTPYDFGTVGSRTTPTMAPQLRKMAATAREQMINAAARAWNVAPSGLTASNGWILDKTTARKTSFGNIAASIDWVHVVGADDCDTPVDQRQYSGKALTKINAADFVTGKHRFTSDLTRPGMLHGSILRPSSFGAKLLSLDDQNASRIPGVRIVRDGDFVGAAAPDEFLAAKAVKALKTTWQEHPQISSAELFSYLPAHPTDAGESRDLGSAAQQPGSPLPNTGQHLENTYTVAYIAHVPLEPRAALAEWNGSHLTVWIGTQRPFNVRAELAEAFHLPEENVRVIVPDTGSAYGGKHTGEHALEAARLAKAAGRPVKLLWTREEEFTWAYFRPAGVITVKSAVSTDGTIADWNFVNYNSGPSGLQSPYNAAVSNIHFQPTEYPLRQGSYRGLAATANHFARESHIDELASCAHVDPLTFRLKNLKEERVRDVLKAAAERFGWSSRKHTPGRGYGLACGMEKGSYFACCAEISLTPNKAIRVERVVEAFDCGAVVNPEHLKNQVEGAIVMGLGGALFEAIDFANGRILNAHLAQYRVPRFSDVPEIEVVLLDRKDLPSAGAGETPIMGIAPAIANALFEATGVRLRSMPILPGYQNAKA